MGCNCHIDETQLSLKKKLRREFKEKVAEVKQLWQDTSDKKITSSKDQLGFKPVE